MKADPASIEENLRLHVDRLAGLTGPRALRRPKTIEATVGYLRRQRLEMEYSGATRVLPAR